MFGMKRSWEGVEGGFWLWLLWVGLGWVIFPLFFRNFAVSRAEVCIYMYDV